ncbi:hypothetical protein SKAU_G00216270 [Synaphobranchus kaupii]|uniref:Rhodanese domain-containing protein n=1 Tax=Synaphobranchus kaupii TaxID=118154 RepID=A0A9Q1ITE9_SYNKA|nr:hypothetical protein SKAU_G00216270 [Synaphobranchus kaupii]
MMALKQCSRLTGILPQIVSKRNFIALAYPGRSLLPCSSCTPRCVYVPYSNVTFSNLLRSYSSASDTDINVSREQLKQILVSRTGVVIDVREPWELREYGNIPGTVNVPLGQVNLALQLNPEEFKEKYGGDKPSHSNNVVFSCLAGVRSKKALDEAVSLGYCNIILVDGKNGQSMKYYRLRTEVSECTGTSIGSRKCLNMGKTADLTIGQKTIIDTLQKMGKPQKVIAKEAGCSQSAVSKHINRKWKNVAGEGAQAKEMTVGFSGLSSKDDS